MDDTQKSTGWTRRSVLRTLGVAGASAATITVTPDVVTEPVTAQEAQQYTTEDVTVESFDGTELAATLYRPNAEGPHASVLTTHGWGGNRQSLVALASKYATEGYAVLAYDSRGFGESGGQVTSTGPNEVKDARTLISWLGDHDAVATDDGGEPRVGMDGASYGGGIQFRTAAVDDRLDAIVPRITWFDLPHSYAPNDVYKVAWATALSRGGESGDIDPEVERISETAQEEGELTDEFVEFYRSRSPISSLHAVRTPTLIVHSWYDRLFTPDQAIATYLGLRKRGVEAGLVMQDGSGHNLGGGPEETEAEQAYVADATLSWMDAHVRGDGHHGVAPVSLYDDAADEFITADHYPPTNRSHVTYDLGLDGHVRLGDAWSSGEGSQDGESGDGGDTRRLATFDFEMDERTELLGSPELEATVVPWGEGDVHLFAALQRVTDDGPTTIKSQVTPTAVERPTRLDLDLFPVHAVLAAGDTLRLAVATEDQAIDDVFVPSQISETALFVDTDEGAGATVLDSFGHGAELTLPVRGAEEKSSGGWW